MLQRAVAASMLLLVGLTSLATASELPPGFQTSEFLLAHGFIDRIVARPQLRTEIARVIDYCV